MDVGNATVAAAAITTVGVVLAALLQRFRAENRKDHAEVIAELRWLRRIVERVETKHDRHIDEFHKGESGGKSRKRGKPREQADAPN